MKALMLIAASLASANSGFGTQYDDDWPPARYQKLGTVKVMFEDQDGINRECGVPSDVTKVMEACANARRIVLPDPCSFPRTENFARLACHELGHRFGNWPSDHPKD